MTSHYIETEAAANQRLEHEFLARHGPEAVGALELLDPAEQVEIVERQPLAAMLPVWERLPPELGGKLLAALPDAALAETLRALDPGRLARLLAVLAEEERARLLTLAGGSIAEEVRTALQYPPDCAGALMDFRARAFFKNSSVAEVLARMRGESRPGRSGFFVVDENNRLAGWVDMQSIALARPDESLAELVGGVSAFVNPMSSREEVVEKMDRHRMTELAVLDLDEKLAGVVRHDSLAVAAREAAAVDMQTMVGVGRDERATSPVFFAVRKRLPWLQVNLLTAFLAALVVGIFESTIARFTALAVLLPVVAGQSGNAGAQALAVAMRGLFLREIRVSHWRRSLLKETSVGFWNGILVALTASAGVFLWSASWGLALIIASSMVFSMIIAGIAGAGIPILLTKLGQDPAQSSSILLTTITDIVAFFSFLGIATLLAGLI